MLSKNQLAATLMLLLLPNGSYGRMLREFNLYHYSTFVKPFASLAQKFKH
jgi:hypothetical protein